jgi:serine/threonine protein kinase
VSSPMLSDLRPGDMLAGKYRVERVIGKGGMGAVLQARHVELEQDVAIKLLLGDSFTDDESKERLERFLREGKTAARLMTAHAAKVFDVGRLPSGQPYLVMELLRGHDLARLLREHGALPPGDVITWVRQACEALGEAHALGVVHRDVKPGNLFLAERPVGAPIIKVLDFGISKLITAGTPEITSTIAVLGSPPYMAPEQFRSVKTADARADIWSLGVVLYQLTTGRRPFNGETAYEMMHQVIEATPVPPSVHRPGLPAAFDSVVLRCLEKQPERRFQSAAELSEALSHLLVPPGLRPFPAVAEPVAPAVNTNDAWGTTFLEARTRARTRTRLWVAACAVGLVCTAGAVIFGLRGPSGETDAPEVAAALPASSPVPAPSASETAAAASRPDPPASASSSTSAAGTSSASASAPSRPPVVATSTAKAGAGPQPRPKPTSTRPSMY